MIGAGNVEEYPPYAFGVGLGRVGGMGGSRVVNELFVGACGFGCRLGLAERVLKSKI